MPLTPENFRLRQEAINAIQTGHFSTAHELLTRCTQINDDWHLIKAGCMLGLNRVEQCFDSLNNIQEKNKKAYYEILANAYSKTQQYVKAAATLKQIQGWKQNIDLILTIARFYEEAGKLSPEHTPARQQLFDYALEVYTHYPNYLDTKKIALALAPLYYLRREYPEALNLYVRIIPEENQRQNDGIQHKIRALKEILLTQANHFIQQGDHQQALYWFETIPNYLKPIDTLKAQGLCYIQCEQYFNANQLYSDLYYNRLQIPEFYHTMMWCIEKQQMASQKQQTVHQHSIFTTDTPPAPPNSPVQPNGTAYDSAHTSTPNGFMANPQNFNYG